MLVHHNDGNKKSFNHTYNETQIDWFRAGSALNLISRKIKPILTI